MRRAQALAAHAAKGVVSDLDGALDGSEGLQIVAEAMVAEIIATDGEPITSGVNISRYDEPMSMVDAAVKCWGHTAAIDMATGLH